MKRSQDSDEMGLGNWAKEIQERLKKKDYVICFIGKKYAVWSRDMGLQKQSRLELICISQDKHLK